MLASQKVGNDGIGTEAGQRVGATSFLHSGRFAPMKSLVSIAEVVSLLLLAVPGWAGPPEDTKVVVEPSPKPTSPWEIKVGAPVWLSWVTGDIGVHGITSHVDVGPNTILRHSNFIASLSGDVRNGRFGVTGDFLYLNGQAGTFTNGLTSKIDLHLEEFLGEFGVYWRMIEGPRGYLDALTGFRYTYTGTRLGLQANDQAITTVSTELVNRFAAQVATAAFDVGALIRQTIDQRLTALRGRNPVLPVPPLAGLEPGRIDELIRSIIESRREALAAAIRAGIQSRVDQLKSQLTNQITARLTTELNRSFSLYENWVDPIIGFRARFNLTKAFYLTGETDVGGFGIGSDIAWQAQAALGCQITRNIYSELGYRFLYDDYRDTNFLYQVTMHGAQITVGLNF